MESETKNSQDIYISIEEACELFCSGVGVQISLNELMERYGGRQLPVFWRVDGADMMANYTAPGSPVDPTEPLVALPPGLYALEIFAGRPSDYGLLGPVQPLERDLAEEYDPIGFDELEHCLAQWDERSYLDLLLRLPDEAPRSARGEAVQSWLLSHQSRQLQWPRIDELSTLRGNIDPLIQAIRTQAIRPPRWQKWRLMPEVEVWEAVALSLGVEPEQIRSNSGARIGADHLFDEGADFDDRLTVTLANLSDRNHFPTPCALSMSSAHRHGVRLAEFAKFAVAVAEWPVPNELRGIAQKVAGDVLRTTQSESTPRPQSRVTPRPAADGVVSLSIGRNGPAEIRAYIEWRAGELYAGNPQATKGILALEIAKELAEKGYCNAQNKQLSAGTVEKAIPAGSTGGRAKNGRKRR